MIEFKSRSRIRRKKRVGAELGGRGGDGGGGGEISQPSHAGKVTKRVSGMEGEKKTVEKKVGNIKEGKMSQILFPAFKRKLMSRLIFQKLITDPADSRVA